MVYVLNKENKPLMPCSNRKARILLKQNKAIVVKRTPFTIKLIYGSSGYKQEITLGIDAGSKTIGVSATTSKKELYAGEVELRNDIVNLLSTRREQRRSRRTRKTRYRAPRFNNRVKSKHKGWLAPSVNNKIDSHITVINNVCSILPVSKIIVEVASFDIQKIKAIETGKEVPTGTDYQAGEQLDFWNVREYVLFRDNHLCACCKCKPKSGDNESTKQKRKILNVHHIESRKTGGNAPNNLITLCEVCHDDYHKGKIKLNLKRGAKYNDATFMGIMRWSLYNKLKETYNIPVQMTYGYITKSTRIKYKLAKTHRIDALCISGNPEAIQLDYVYYQKKIRCHNRQIHKCTINKGGTRKLNQLPYIVKGFRLFDKVKYNNTECFITGRRSTGYFKLTKLDGTVIHNSAKSSNLKLIEKSKKYLTEIR